MVLHATVVSTHARRIVRRFFLCSKKHPNKFRPMAAPSAAATPVLSNAGSFELEKVTSSTHRAGYQLLARVAKGPRATEFPELASMFSGSKQQKQEVLQRFVSEGCNLESCEASFKAKKELSLKLHAGRQQMTILQMREAKFTECLDST